MHKVDDFLVEIGCEELPPKSLWALAESFAEHIKAGLLKEELAHEKIRVFATPRRIAVLVEQLQLQQADREIEKRGPALAAAYDAEGNPSKACLGFAKSCGVTVDDLQTIETDKGKWLVYQQKIAGLAAKLLLSDIVRHAIKQLPIAKPMRWGNYPTEFIRPVHWVLMLLGEHVVDAEILGCHADRHTYGHRFHHPQAITIAHPRDYEAVLKNEGYVIADFSKRRELIIEQVRAVAKSCGYQAIIDDDLLNEVTGIVEWPVALLAAFDKAFLDVPAEALIAAMSDHQKSFHLVNGAQALQANFITVSNIESSDPAHVIHGNERVMRARLADAAFFYNADQQVSLANRIESTKHVTFQAKLGSLFDKSTRLMQLSKIIAAYFSVDSVLAVRAASLAKTDLMTDMVGEFPELQGTMGYYYALHDGENNAVAIALKEQYFPRFSGDDLPQTDLGRILALAERIDTLIGIFGINQQPSGLKDPFKLRRAALGVIRILLDSKINLNIIELLQQAVVDYSQPLVNKNVVDEVQKFIIERMRRWYLDQGFSGDILNAVLQRQTHCVYDFDCRVKAVAEFREMHEAQVLAVANKRVSKLLEKETMINGESGIDDSLFEFTAERNLSAMINSKELVVMPLFAQANYKQALFELARLGEPVDQFFVDVMVMVDDEKVRKNRLALLAKLRKLFLQVADISLLQS